jgi:hypothetical protein
LTAAGEVAVRDAHHASGVIAVPGTPRPETA